MAELGNIETNTQQLGTPSALPAAVFRPISAGFLLFFGLSWGPVPFILLFSVFSLVKILWISTLCIRSFLFII